MKHARHPVTILMADDDRDEYMLIKSAFEENCLANDLRFVTDGEEAMDYLKCRGRFAEPTESPRPGLILLDLNMPRKDGLETLFEIKNDPDLKRIPVIILSTSQSEEDVKKCYSLSANSFISKPAAFDEIVGMVGDLSRYWLQTVELPPLEPCSNTPPTASVLSR